MTLEGEFPGGDWRPIAAEMALLTYADEPCRICGKQLTAGDLYFGAVFVGYSDDHKSRVAHKQCWQGFVDVLLKAEQSGNLATLLETMRGRA